MDDSSIHGVFSVLPDLQNPIIEKIPVSYGTNKLCIRWPPSSSSSPVPGATTKATELQSVTLFCRTVLTGCPLWEQALPGWV